jgi:hypothetical protein
VNHRIEEKEIKGREKYELENFAVAASVLFLVSIAGNLYWLNRQSEAKKKL